MPTIFDKRRTFHDLHKSGCFVIPNLWDIGSARYLQHLGFKALATTSAGFSRPNGRVSETSGQIVSYKLMRASAQLRPLRA